MGFGSLPIFWNSVLSKKISDHIFYFCKFCIFFPLFLSGVSAEQGNLTDSLCFSLVSGLKISAFGFLVLQIVEGFCGVVAFVWFSMAAVAEIPADANKMDSKPKAESEFSVQKLVDMFTKLNPLAKEFFPSSYSPNHDNRFQGFNQLSPTHFLVSTKPSADENFPNNRRVGLFCLWSHIFRF